VMINFEVPAQAFAYICSAATLGAIRSSEVIVSCLLVYRRRVARGGSLQSVQAAARQAAVLGATLRFLAFITVLLDFDNDSRMALYPLPPGSSSSSVRTGCSAGHGLGHDQGWPLTMLARRGRGERAGEGFHASQTAQLATPHRVEGSRGAAADEPEEESSTIGKEASTQRSSWLPPFRLGQAQPLVGHPGGARPARCPAAGPARRSPGAMASRGG
jgi:hypothetical protein